MSKPQTYAEALHDYREARYFAQKHANNPQLAQLYADIEVRRMVDLITFASDAAQKAGCGSDFASISKFVDGLKSA